MKQNFSLISGDYIPGLPRAIAVILGIAAILVIASWLTGCHGIVVGNIKKHDETPKMFVKEGATRQQMTNDSLDCQDLALAADGSYDNYVSTMGYTEAQVQMYDNCMYAKGYKSK